MSALDLLEGRLRPRVRAEAHLRAVMAEVEEHAWRRACRLRAYRTAADWQDHVRRTRKRFRAALGPLPERTPLRVERTGVLERRGYVVEKLLIETQPSFYVTANLYLPAPLGGRAPGIVSPVGHWPHSKGQEVEQARMAGLARKGYVGLIWDPVGQGERSQYWDAARGVPPIPPGTSQHAAICHPAFLIGSTVITTMVWDGVRMIDYLASRPEVDPARLGCTGVSGGGTYTMFLGAFDERLKATVPVCSTSRYERMYTRGLIGDPCQDPFRSLPDDLDMADLLLAHAPAAVRLIGTRYDFFPLAGLREAYLDVLDGYTALGIPERADLQVVDAHHDYNREQRELMYAWFNRWLDHEAPVEEEPFEPDEPRALWVTATGQLLTSAGGKTVPDLVRDLAERLVPAPVPMETRAAAWREQERVRRAVAEVLGPLPPLDGAPPAGLEPIEAGGLIVERVILQAQLDVPLPALVFRPDAAPPGSPEGGTRHAAVVLLDDRGKTAESGPDGLAPALAQAGLLAMAVDLRGWGETAWTDDLWGWKRERHELLSAESMLAYVGYMLGRSSVAQRVHDVLGILAYLRARPDVDSARVALLGIGGGAIVALHAAALDGKLSGVAACDALATYHSIVEAPCATRSAADLVPGALLQYDLPDLAASLAPASVLVANPQDALGRPLAPEAATSTYARARRMAALLGGELRVQMPLPPDARRAAVGSWAVQQAASWREAIAARSTSEPERAGQGRSAAATEAS